MTDRFVTPEEIAAFETRVMSVGHGVLSDSEWRRLIDTLEYTREELARRGEVMDRWWEDHKRITDDLRAENARLRKIVDLYWPDSEPNE